MSKKDAFFQKMDALGLALTFDDVRLQTGFSVVTPDQVSLKTRFSRKVPLLVPITSAAMDTVTGPKMAIALAKLGGLGVIHYNNTPQEQAKAVAKVKYHLNGIVLKPITVRPHETIAEVLRRCEIKGYDFRSFPVVDNDGKLVGVVSSNDFAFCTDKLHTVADVMSTDVLTSDETTGLKKAFELMQKARRKLLPILDKVGRVVSLFTWADVCRITLDGEQTHNVDNDGRLRVGAAISTRTEDLERAELLYQENVDVLVIDSAHSDRQSVYDLVPRLREVCSEVDIVVGNVSEPESAERLVKLGVDGIKVGQGPGSICTTRKVAGIGCPQVTAVYKCSRVAEGYGIPVCADGGLNYSGDVTIAIGAGACSVMMGSLLAGTDEAPGSVVFRDGRYWKHYRGMGALGAMQDNVNARHRYGETAAHVAAEQLVPEGVESWVPYKGPLEPQLHQLLGGLRKGMAYVGAGTIDELREQADFWRISAAGDAESHPHDVVLDQNTPNYRWGG